MSEPVKFAMYAVTIFAVLLSGSMYLGKSLKKQENARKDVVCPSFLSIARSARDTLIVMRNEPLCNRYVLDNLQ